jgi:ribonuclease III
MKELARLLNYQFINENLLLQALTHPSVAQNYYQTKIANYERLELLGDSVLSLVITEWLLQRFPDDDEGLLARKRATLICGNFLCKIATHLGIQQYIVMSEGEEKAGGKTNARILENVIESIIGAMYLDGGLEVCKKFIQTFWEEAIIEANIVPVDPKAFLQEWAQKHGKPIPSYSIIAQEGPAHKPIFTVEVIVEGIPKFQAQGHSRKVAEKLAAEQGVVYINDKKNDECN